MFGKSSTILKDMLRKDYSKWFALKSQLQFRHTEVYYAEREVWWVAIGSNVGYEEDGKGDEFSRPVLVFRKFNQHFFVGIPLSTTKKIGRYYYHLTIGVHQNTALLSQIRAFDAQRLINRYGWVNEADYQNIQYRLIDVLVAR